MTRRNDEKKLDDSAFVDQLTLLTGQAPEWPAPEYVPLDERVIFGGGGLGYSQLNEFLLALGYDRVTRAFFNYFMCPEETKCHIEKPDRQSPFRIETFAQFKAAVERFRKLAMLKYGNFKFAFKRLSRMTWREIGEELEEYEPVPADQYTKRPVPLIDPFEIDRQCTYLLGYIAGDRVRELKKRKDQQEQLRPEEEEVIRLREDVVRRGIRNYYKSLTDDYMDVYVATSMRRREEFYAVYDFVRRVFSHEAVKDLKLRFFDPTQADPQDRLAKGLLEGLMVKRAKCTIYCAQESDTFGKDSELAATLAQGKPVVAYVPRIDNVAEYEEELKGVLRECSEGDPARYAREVLLDRHPRCVLDNPTLIRPDASFEEMVKELAWRDQRLYSNRAKTLQEIHPLSLQINLQTGVANGVIVVRSAEECGVVVRGIILRTLEFDIDTIKADEGRLESFVLRERSTGSIFRVVTGDPVLTNSFWNFYLPRVP